VDEHAVHYYEDDDEYVAFVSAHLAAGVEAGEHVIAVASAVHVSALERLLSDHLDGSSGRWPGRLVLLDARETLELFMVDGSPDPSRFHSTVAPLVSEAGQGGTPVRAFGEMVALLWDDGNVAGAIELEGLWNDLLQHERFTLLCGYPTTTLTGVSLRDVQAVCDLHSAVLPPPSYGSTTLDDDAYADDHSALRSEVFVPVAQAVRATRRFVFGTLDAWGLQELQWDAALVVSELANNAVRHGASPFRVLVTRAGGGVRIGIHDVAPGRPLQRSAAIEDVDGRGMAIIEALSTGWGCERLSDGKFTWADLAAAPVA
jgi:anti-sigma regulatory factor (Ser/Thr protein kinase)